MFSWTAWCALCIVWWSAAAIPYAGDRLRHWKLLVQCWGNISGCSWFKGARSATPTICDVLQGLIFACESPDETAAGRLESSAAVSVPVSSSFQATFVPLPSGPWWAWAVGFVNTSESSGKSSTSRGYFLHPTIYLKQSWTMDRHWLTYECNRMQTQSAAGSTEFQRANRSWKISCTILNINNTTSFLAVRKCTFQLSRAKRSFFWVRAAR